SVAGCVLELVYYKPHRKCGALYRITLRDGAAFGVEEWVFAQAFAPEIGRQRFALLETCLTGKSPACPVLRDAAPPGYWDDLHLSVSVFPRDRKMPTLHLAVDPDLVRRSLEAHPEVRHALGAPAGPVAIGFDRLKYMPGKRCVLR